LNEAFNTAPFAVNSHSPAHPDSDNHDGWWTRDHTSFIVLSAVTVLLLVLCWMILQPFFAPIAWAVALAVVAHPFHTWVATRLKRPGLAAGLTVFAVAMIILVPAFFVGQQLVSEGIKGMNTVQSSFESGRWQEQAARIPGISTALSLLDQQGNLGGQMMGMTKDAGERMAKAVTGSAWALAELLLTLFVLFYLFRDRRQVLDFLRSLVPLSKRETTQVFARVSDTIHATIYGTLVVAMVQGVLGGLMFWWLGLPAPLLWGAVMALLAIVPVLGAFVVWIPAAVFLAASGHWGKALILAVWGGVVVALIDNLLYPILVGKRLRMHTVPVFFSIVGGLAIFGAAGLVLGPVILALTDAILDIWTRRTAHGQAAEAAASK
jgi:predicted PurR-regulated permease PerM